MCLLLLSMLVYTICRLNRNKQHWEGKGKHGKGKKGVCVKCPNYFCLRLQFTFRTPRTNSSYLYTKKGLLWLHISCFTHFWSTHMCPTQKVLTYTRYNDDTLVYSPKASCFCLKSFRVCFMLRYCLIVNLRGAQLLRLSKFLMTSVC